MAKKTHPKAAKKPQHNNKPAYVILQKMLLQYNLPFTQKDVDKINWNSPETIDKDGMYCYFFTYPIGVRLQCLPHADGGYIALLYVENQETFRMENYTFYYKDGEMTNPTDILPAVSIDDFYTNAAEFPKDVYDELTKLISYPVYIYDPADSKLKTTFVLLYSDSEAIRKYGQARKSTSGPQIFHTWDGRQFVRRADSKPFDEDLSIFGVEGYVVHNPENIAVEAIKQFFANDPFELGLTQQEYLAQYGDRIHRFSPTIASCDVMVKNENGIIKHFYHFQFACYEYTDGGHIALCYQDKESKLALYTLKDGKLTPLADAFPPFDQDKAKQLSQNELKFESGFSLYPFTYDGFQTHFKTYEMNPKTFDIKETGHETATYKWDGKQFVKH